MDKRVDSEDNSHYDNERRNRAENETRQEKHASNILIKVENEKDHDITGNAQFMMKDSHEKRWSHQRGVDLLMFFHKNERQLGNNNHENVVSCLHTN